MAATNPLLLQTRRHFFGQCGLGIGAAALASLFNDGRAAADDGALVNPLAPKKPHFPAKAKRVIFLFMAGGPSQLELFDYKPKLHELHGKPIPDEFIKGKRFAFMDTFAKETPKLLATRRKFARHGQAGTWVSECLPHIAGIVDDIAVVRSMATNVFNHAPAKLFVNTGSPQFGRPSMGAWVTYGIGSEAQRPARLRGAAVRPARPARRRPAVGQRLSADHLPGRAVPQRRRADPQPRQSDGRRRRPAARRARRRDGPERRRTWPTPATRRSPRASPPTRWPTGCRRAPRS